MIRKGVIGSRFVCGASALALLSAISGAAAQPANNSDIEEVIVTGTNIRGVQPVGSNIISATRIDLDKTNVQSMQQIYKTIPALSNMGALPQGNQSGNAYYSPTIHNLGSSSSNSTLVLIDGHRFSLGSQQQPLSDPGIVPANAQGELQGGMTSISSLTAIVSPLFMTQLFGFFTSAAAPFHFPGASFLAAALLELAAFLLLARVIRTAASRSGNSS